MSGRFPKCPNPDCSRILIRRLNSTVLTCGGCKQTFQAEDINTVDQKSNQEETSSNGSLSNSARNQMYSNLTKKLNKTKLTYSSGSSVSSEETTTEREQNGQNDESFAPINRRLNGDFYEGSVSSRSISSDENGSTISRNTGATSRRTHKRDVSKDSNLRYESNLEETNYRQNQPDLNLNTNKSFGSEERFGYSSGRDVNSNKSFQRQEGLGYSSGRDLNSNKSFERQDKLAYSSGRESNASIDRGDRSKQPFNSRNEERSHKYYSKSEDEDESNYPLNRFKINPNPIKRNSRENTISVHSGSIISEDEMEERERDPNFNRNFINSRDYERNSNAEYEEPNYSLNRFKINPRPIRRDFRENTSSVRGSIISEEDIEEREIEETQGSTFNQTYANIREKRTSNYSFDGSNSSKSFSSDGSGSRISTGDSRFKSYRTHERNISNGTHSSTELNPVEKPRLQNNVPNSNHQSDLHDVVNELAKYGVTREKLIMLLLNQTNTNNNYNHDHERNKRTLMRKLSFAPKTYDETPRSTENSTSSKGRRKPAKHRCRPVMDGTPFVICEGCLVLLQLPVFGLDKNKELIKIRCGDCDETHIYRFPAKKGRYIALHKEMGYESARILTAPSKQFSYMDDDDD